MLTNQEKIARLRVEYAEANKKEKAKFTEKKDVLLSAAARQNKLLEKQTEMAIVKIIRQGIFPRMKLIGMPAADEVVRLENKAIDARLNVIIDRVQAGDRLGALKALKLELDAAIGRIEAAEKGRVEIEKRIAERDGKLMKNDEKNDDGTVMKG